MDRLSLAAFVRISAVSIGMVNLAVIWAVAMRSAATGAEELVGLNVFHLLAGLSAGTVAGLLTAEVLLRLTPGALQSGYFSRYAVMLLGVCLGGALIILLPAICFAAVVSVSDSVGEAGGVLLTAIPFALLGGTTGLAEGLVLAFPLAAILGRFSTAG